MSETLLNHLWQSTLFAGAAALLALAFRSNGASVRFNIWLAASLKFLVPFPLLVLIGAHLHWSTPGTIRAAPRWSVLMSQILQPASSMKLDLGPLLSGAPTAISNTPTAISGTPAATSNTPTAISGAPAATSNTPTATSGTTTAVSGTTSTPSSAVTTPSIDTASTPTVSNAPWPHWALATWALLIWSIGCAVLLARWFLQWLKLHAIVATAVPLDIEAPVPVRETAMTLEPGAWGILTPVLLLPRGIATRLTSEELDSILEHELCHLSRQDNLAAALHMLVEVLFWFHPLVWWLGNRMVIERERACDEQVVQAGIDRQTYAEGILKVCRLYVEPPLLCAAGVSGGTLKQRIEDIMTNQATLKLHLAKKCLLSAAALAAVAAPVTIGLMFGPQGLAQAQATAASNTPAMRHYQNKEWSFGLDVPQGWNRFPPNLAASPHEIMRFGSGESGRQLLIIFRNFFSAQKGLAGYITVDEAGLEKKGYSHFVTGEATIGSQHVVTLDFERPTADGGTWSVHQYLIVNGTLLYTLSFSTDGNLQDMAGLSDWVANSFTFDPST